MKAKGHSLRLIKCKPLLLVALIIVSSAISLIASSPIFAAIPSGDTIDFSQDPSASFTSGDGANFTPEDQALSAEYYVTLERCFRWAIPDNGSFSVDGVNPSASQWFTKTDNAAAYINGGQTTCIDITDNALKLWGWVKSDGSIDRAGFLKSAGCNYDGTSKYSCDSDRSKRSLNFRTTVLAKAYSGLDGNTKNSLLSDIQTGDPFEPSVADDSKIPLSNSALYAMLFGIFTSKCGASDLGTMADINSAAAVSGSDQTTKNRIDQGYSTGTYDKTTVWGSVNIVTSSGVVPHGYTYLTSYTSVVDTSGGSGEGNAPIENEISIFGHVNANTKKLDTVKGLPTETSETCTDIKNQVNKYAPDDYIFKRNQPTAVPQQPKTIDCTTNPDAADCTPSTTSCAINGIGWIICPVINFLAGIADTTFSFLSENFLSITPSLLNTDPTATDSKGNLVGTGAYQAWQQMRTIANVVLVIGFLIIIFSQLTSVGIDNYGIKKLLPKLVFIAILINLSFIICQLGVDLSNILGYGLKSMFAGMTSGITVNAAKSTSDLWTSIATGVLSTGGVVAGTAVAVTAAGGIGLALVALIGIIISVVIATLMVFFILIVRQMLIVLLVVIAPLAFAAYLLPNTADWFKKWGKLFFEMLMLFPIVGVLFGASTLASVVLQSVWASTDNVVGQIVAKGILVIPLFLVMPILNGALKGIGTLGATLGGLGDKWGKSAQQRVANSDYSKHLQAKHAEDVARTAAGNYRGGNPFRKLGSRINSGLNDNRGFNVLTRGYGASRFLSRQGQDRKDMADAVSMFNGDDGLIETWAATGGDIAAARAYTTSDGKKLTDTQIKQMQRMRDAGHHRKATSFFAAGSAMATGGKGNTAAFANALANAAKAGASATDIDGSWQANLAAYRNSGRGDVVGEMTAQRAANGNATPLGTAQFHATSIDLFKGRKAGWGQVSASSVHREGIKLDRDPRSGALRGTGILAGSGAQAYLNYLSASPDTTTTALRAYESMEGRAKQDAAVLIIRAADHILGSGGGNPPITSIAEAKRAFGVIT